jgi:serine/threonine protein kinase
MHQPSEHPDIDLELSLAGRRIRLDNTNRIGKGGEGSVHNIGGTACKVYFPDCIDDRKREKLRVLQALRVAYPDNVAAPMDLLLDNNGIVQGYQMPLLSGKHIEELRDPDARGTAKHDTDAINVLLDLLRTLQALHRSRVIVGDLNPRNVLYNPPDAYLIDFDSVQVMGYPCSVAGVQYSIDPVVFRYFKTGTIIDDMFHTADTDNYSFAVIAFENLMWTHPRKGFPNDPNIPDPTTDAGENQWLLQGKWWVFSHGVIAPRCCRPPNWLNHDLYEWFKTYFTTDERPEPTLDMFEQQLHKIGSKPLPRVTVKPAIHPQLVNHNRMTGDKSNTWGDARNLMGDCSGLSGDVSGLSGIISIWGRVRGLRGNINRIRGDVSGIQGDHSNITGDCSGLSGNVTNISGDVTNIRGEIHVAGNVSRLSGDISLLWGNLGPDCRVWGDATGCQLNVGQHQGPVETITYMLREMGYGYYFGRPIINKRSLPSRP